MHYDESRVPTAKRDLRGAGASLSVGNLVRTDRRDPEWWLARPEGLPQGRLVRWVGPDARSRSGSDCSVVTAVLIELSGGEGVVRSDDGEIVLTHDVRLEWGQLLQPHDSYWWRILASAGIIV